MDEDRMRATLLVRVSAFMFLSVLWHWWLTSTSDCSDWLDSHGRWVPITQSTGRHSSAVLRSILLTCYSTKTAVDICHRQRTRPSYQVDQGSCTYLQGRSSSYESRRGQLSVESRLRPLSWCDSWSSHQDSEELSTSFFWWRSRDEIEMSK